MLVQTNSVYYPKEDMSIEMPNPPAVTFPFECDLWQKQAFHIIEKGDDLLACLPTSSGKTIAAIYAIVHTVKNLKQRVIYTCPIKSLSNEKYNEFSQKFLEYGITVGILTGDNKINPTADILMVTAEILHNSLYNTEKKIENSRYNLPDNFIDSIGCVIMDEIHYMNDRERGRVWEITIIMLPPKVQLIMLSGTIGNRDYFANWISKSRKKNVAVIYQSKRVIPLRHYIYINKTLHEYLDVNEQYLSMAFNNARKIHEEQKKEREKRHKIYDERVDILSMINYLKDNDMLQAIFFSFSRKDCEKYADMLSGIDFLDREEKNQVDFWFHKYIGSQRDESGEYKFRNIVQVQQVKEMIERGVAYHHSTMLQNLRELIEILMKKKLIKVLFATETLCIGVNVPAKTCIFTGLVKPTEKSRRNINTSEYRQMAGRAGRRGIDTSGNVIFLPLREFPHEEDFRGVVTGVIPDIKSNFQFDYQSILKLAQIIGDKVNIIDLYSKSLMNSENLDVVVEYEKQKNILIVEIDKVSEKLETISISDEEKNFVIKLLEIEQKKADNPNFVFSKKQEQEQKSLRTSIFGNLAVKEYYQILKKYNEYENQINKIDDKIFTAQNFIKEMYNNYCNVLRDLGYVRCDIREEEREEKREEKREVEIKNIGLKKSDLMIEGIICSQINDCNVLLLTQIIKQNYFSNMSVQEIVSIISIFTDPIQKDKACLPHEFDGTELLHSTIDEILRCVNRFETIEKKYLSLDICSDFTICTDYMDIAYDWANGATVYDMTAYFQEYEIPPESFCKNMLRISNIIQTVLGIYKMLNTNIEVIPKLEEANAKVLRDIVSTTSLYL
jgi:superfamily II RNA helicase